MAEQPTRSGTRFRQPNRTVNNTTIRAPDVSQPYYENRLFSEVPGAVSMRNFYIEQSSNRYTVNGVVEDWVIGPLQRSQLRVELSRRHRVCAHLAVRLRLRERLVRCAISITSDPFTPAKVKRLAAALMGPENYNTKQAQPLVVLLPDCSRWIPSSAIPMPAADFDHSGSGNALDNSMTRQVTLPAGVVSFAAKVRCDIGLHWGLRLPDRQRHSGCHVPVDQYRSERPEFWQWHHGL